MNLIQTTAATVQGRCRRNLVYTSSFQFQTHRQWQLEKLVGLNKHIHRWIQLTTISIITHTHTHTQRQSSQRQSCNQRGSTIDRLNTPAAQNKNAGKLRRLDIQISRSVTAAANPILWYNSCTYSTKKTFKNNNKYKHGFCNTFYLFCVHNKEYFAQTNARCGGALPLYDLRVGEG